MKKAPTRPKMRPVVGSRKKTEIIVRSPRKIAKTSMIVKPIVRFNAPSPLVTIHSHPRELNPALL
jgi:hypothetical protein